MFNKRITISIFIGFIIIILAIMVFDRPSRSVSDTNDGAIEVLDNSFFDKNSADSDGDKLLDWEEIVWGSDRYNADTDNDGVSDGEEISRGTSPLVAGPGDEITNKELERVNTQLEIQDVLSVNQTQTTINQALPSILVRADDNLTGSALSKTDNFNLENLSSSVAEELGKNVLVYTESDIKTISDDGANRISYIETILNIAVDLVDESASNELVTLAKAIDANDENMLKVLEKNDVFYESMKKNLLKTSVPSGFKDLHLGLINSYEELSLSVKEMQKIINDPLSGLVGIERYKKHTDSVFLIYEKLGKELSLINT